MNPTDIYGILIEAVWGTPMLLLMLGVGGYFSIRTRFFQLRRFKHCLKSTVLSAVKSVKTAERGSVTPFQAMCSALAATLGTGNIAGVATALAAGGAGAVFWMWISALFGMMTGYAENVLGHLYRKKIDGVWQGGAMRYIRDGLSEVPRVRFLAKPLSALFAVLCVLSAFGMGNMAQINSAAGALNASFGVSPLAVGIVGAALTGLIIFGGAQRIGKVAEKIVPLMSAFYILGSLYIIFANITRLPSVFSAIMENALGLRAAGGGILGYAVKRAMSVGLRRGVFSNEAGLGTSPAAHAASAVKDPVVQGMWSIFEVFFDTIVMCTMTALVLLSAGNRAPAFDEVMRSVSLEPQYAALSDGLINDGIAQPTVGGGEEVRCLTVYGGEFSLSLSEGEQTCVGVVSVRGVQSADAAGNLLWLDSEHTRPLIETVEILPVNGAALAAFAFSDSFGRAAGGLLSIAVALFAFSTVIGWSYFGSQAAEFLWGKRAGTAFRIAFTAVTVVGACLELTLVWNICDLLNGCMALPNLFAVVCLSGTVLRETARYCKKEFGKAH